MRTAPSFYYSKRLLGGLHMKEAFITKVACSKNDRHSDTERKTGWIRNAIIDGSFCHGRENWCPPSEAG